MELKKELKKVAQELKNNEAILKPNFSTLELLKKAAYIRLKTFSRYINH